MADHSKRMTNLFNRLAIGALALGISLSALPTPAQQNQQQQDQQQDQTQAQQDQDQSPDATVQDQGRDSGPQQQPARQQNAQDQDTQAQPPAIVPDMLTLPAGTVVQVRTTDWLSSDHNQKGDQVVLTLAQPLVVNGWLIARRGQTVMGTVVDAQKAGRVKGVSKLGLSLGQVTLVDGQLVTAQTTLMHASAGTSNGRDAVAVGATTGFGAAVGAAAAGGPGAAIGAGAGFVASIAGVLITRGRPTVFPPETLLTFRTEAPITVSTVRSQMAFHPVSSRDYANNARRNRPRLAGPYGAPPSPYGYYYPYAYPYGIGFYPAPVYFGYYGGWYGRRWR